MTRDQAQELTNEAKTFLGEPWIVNIPEKSIYEKYTVKDVIIQSDGKGGFRSMVKFVSHNGNEQYLDAQAVIEKFTNH